ncbi:Katanin p80 WD40 repeat-containing subunit B1-like protein, partial [Diplonema papillatum]
GSMDATVKYWDTRQQQPLQALKGLHSAITCLAISPDGGRVVSGDEDGKLSIVDVRKWKVIGECSISSAVTSLRLHPLELFLAAGTADGLIHLINVGTPPAPTGMLKHSMSRPVWSVDLVPGPNQVDSLFSTSSDGLKLHQGTSLTGSYDFSWDGDVLESAYMECSGKVLFASAHRNEVRLWGCDANMVAQGGVSAHQVAPAPAAQPTARPAQSSGLVKVKPQKMIRKSKEVGHTSTRGHLIQNPRYRQDGVHGTLIELEPREALDLDLSRWRNADGRIPPTKTPRDQLVKELADTGGKMEVLLMRRLEAAKVIRTLWASGNRTAAIDHARKASEIDFGVGLDFLNLIVTQQKAKEMLALEQCVALLPLVMVTLMSGVDAGVLVAIRALRFLFNKFYSNVQRTLAGPKGVGVDLQHEDRVAAAGDASQKFADAKRSLRHVVSGSPAGDGAAAALVAEEGKQLLKDFESLDS